MTDDTPDNASAAAVLLTVDPTSGAVIASNPPDDDTPTEIENADMAGLIDGADDADAGLAVPVPELVVNVRTLERARALPELAEGIACAVPTVEEGSVERFIDTDGCTKIVVLAETGEVCKTPAAEPQADA